MAKSRETDIKARYMAALDSFIEKIKGDTNIIAVIASGSIAYDVVWEKSDIDLTIVVRDQNLSTDSYCIVEDEIIINAYLMPRSAFKRGMEKNIGGTFGQAYFAKGKIVYCTDDSLYEYFEDIKRIGTDDIALSTFNMASQLVGCYDKCQKWLKARKDPLYAQFFILKASEIIANMEMCFNGEPTSREAIQKALKMNPGIMEPLYINAMSHHMTEDEVIGAIDMIDNYLVEHLDIIKKPAIEFLSGQEMKTVTMIVKHFRVDSHFIVEIFEYLADKGVIERVTQTIRITPKSKPVVEELGYMYIP